MLWQCAWLFSVQPIRRNQECFCETAGLTTWSNYKLASGMGLLKQAAAKQGEAPGENVAADLRGRWLRI